MEETLGDTCDIETVKNIHEKMNEIVQEHKEDPEPVVLDKNEVKTIFASSGVANDRMEVFDQCFDATAGEATSLMMTNVYNPRSFEVKTPDVVIKVNPERTDLVNTKLSTADSASSANWTVISKSTASPSGLPEAETAKNLKNKPPAKRQESHNESFQQQRDK